MNNRAFRGAASGFCTDSSADNHDVFPFVESEDMVLALIPSCRPALDQRPEFAFESCNDGDSFVHSKLKIVISSVADRETIRKVEKPFGKLRAGSALTLQSDDHQSCEQTAGSSASLGMTV